MRIKNVSYAVPLHLRQFRNNLVSFGGSREGGKRVSFIVLATIVMAEVVHKKLAESSSFRVAGKLTQEYQELQSPPSTHTGCDMISTGGKADGRFPTARQLFCATF